MNNVTYIDTRPGKSIFSAPKGEPDYSAWITNKYKKQQYKDGEHTCYLGLPQKLHHIIQSNDEPKIIVFGTHSNQLKDFIILIAKQIGKQIDIEVTSA